MLRAMHVAVALLLSTSPSMAAAADRLPLSKTHPGQAGALPYDPETKRAEAPQRPAPRARDRIVYAFDGPAKARLARRADLTDACRRGTFRQRVDGLYRAFGTGERPLGVADGFMATNLVDVAQLRDKDTVYFFDKQDTGRCTVFSARRDEVRRWFVPP